MKNSDLREALGEARNELHSLLILDTAPAGEDIDAHMEEWISSGKPEKFLDIWNTLLSENPNLLDDWTGDREKVIKRAKELMDK